MALGKRTRYNLAHNVATKGLMGRMIPFCSLEVCPGDTFNGVVGLLVRMSQLKKAWLTDVFVDSFLFYVPHRLVWDEWESFITDGPMDTPNHQVPQINIARGDDEFPLLRYYADNDNTNPNIHTYSAFRLRAYNLIYNEYFRDDDQAVIGADYKADKEGLQVNQRKNYFSTMSDRAGEGQPEHFAPVEGDQVSAIEILRSIAQQKIALKRTTYGTRYIDVLRGYGINVNYQMLQRPEILSVGRGTLNVTDVVATQGEGALGELGGHGISGSRVRLRRRQFPEHGTLMGIVVLRPQYHFTYAADWFDTPSPYEHYFDPGLSVMPPINVPDRKLWPPSDNADQLAGWMPYYNWYRNAISWHHPDLALQVPDHYSRSGNKNPDRNDFTRCTSDYYNSIFANGGNGEQPEDRPPEGHFQVAAVNKFSALRCIPRHSGVAFSGST